MEEKWISDPREDALSCNLESLFKFYGLNIDNHNNKVVCPFKSHKGGMEKTASFVYYSNTNSYWCFGCKQGSSVIDFVMNYENCSSDHAIEKILNYKNLKFNLISNENKTIENRIVFDLKLKFSELLHDNPDKDIMKTYDSLIDKYDLDNDSMIYILNKLIKKMEG